jgi:hypothetical protein
MPNPSKFDNEKDFISACIPKVLSEGTAKDQSQASAICYTMWRDHRDQKTLKDFFGKVAKNLKGK